MSGVLAKIFLSMIIVLQDGILVYSYHTSGGVCVFIPFVGNFTTKLTACYPMNIASYLLCRCKYSVDASTLQPAAMWLKVSWTTTNKFFKNEFKLLAFEI